MWKRREERGSLFLPLIDQEETSPEECTRRAALFEESGADALLVGSSFALGDRLAEVVAAAKKGSSLPVILFPGSSHQVCREADGILFLTLLSGRNPLYLAEEQVRSAPRVREYGLEAIPTAYLLIGCGGRRTVHFVSGTEPIPGDRPEIAMAHALAAEYMGMRLVYLEAGSGAAHPVPPSLIRSVADYVSLPLMVGGGIRTPEEARAARDAGAHFVVIGHALEREPSGDLARAFADAIHGETVAARSGG